MTWSPFFTEVTPGPTSTTMPAPSWPRMAGKRPSGSAPDSVKSSVWQMPVALTSTSTSPARGPSSCTVMISSGLPAATATAARTSMVVSPFPQPRSWHFGPCRAGSCGRREPSPDAISSLRDTGVVFVEQRHPIVEQKPVYFGLVVPDECIERAFPMLVGRPDAHRDPIGHPLAALFLDQRHDGEGGAGFSGIITRHRPPDHGRSEEHTSELQS